VEEGAPTYEGEKVWVIGDVQAGNGGKGRYFVGGGGLNFGIKRYMRGKDRVP